MDNYGEELVWIECLSIILKSFKKVFVVENVKSREKHKVNLLYHYPAGTVTNILLILLL